MHIYLKENIIRMIQEKKLDWPSYRKDKIDEIDRKLDNGSIKLDEAIEMIEKEFHKDIVIDKKMDKYYLEDIEKKIRRGEH